MSDEQPENLEQRARTLLQESAERLDARTRSRLTQSRHAALDAIRLRPQNIWRWLAPVSGATATAIVGAILMMNPGIRSGHVAPITVADEFEIVTAEDSLEFYRDVEFYSWLDTVLDEAPAEESGV